MGTLTVGSKTVETDEEGYLVNRPTGDEEIAKEMASTDNCDLTQNHWEVINFLREYYDEYQIAPAVRVLTKAIGKKLGADKGNQQVPVRAVPVRPGQAGVQIRRPAEADRLRLRLAGIVPGLPAAGRAAHMPCLALFHDKFGVSMSACDSCLRAVFYVATADPRHRRCPQDFHLCAHAAAAEDPDHTRTHDPPRRGGAHGARGHGLRKSVQVEQVDLAVRLGVPPVRCSWNCSATCATSPSRSVFPALAGGHLELHRRLRRIRHGPGSAACGGAASWSTGCATSATRPTPDADPAGRHRRQRHGHEVPVRTPTSSRLKAFFLG
jgi:dissimilatory sulfite reductase related protein